MWTTWLIVGFAFAMVVGPVMMLMPSPGQARVAKLRTMASQKGFSIRARREKLGGMDSAPRETMVYSLSWPTDEARKSASDLQWQMDKSNYDHGTHFFKHWEWKIEVAFSEAQRRHVLQALEAVPEGVTSIGINPMGAFCVWDEASRGQTQEALLSQLFEFLSHLMGGFCLPGENRPQHES